MVAVLIRLVPNLNRHNNVLPNRIHHTLRCSNQDIRVGIMVVDLRQPEGFGRSQKLRQAPETWADGFDCSALSGSGGGGSFEGGVVGDYVPVFPALVSVALLALGEEKLQCDTHPLVPPTLKMGLPPDFSKSALRRLMLYW
jgi:hypothetical protein